MTCPKSNSYPLLKDTYLGALEVALINSIFKLKVKQHFVNVPKMYVNLYPMRTCHKVCKCL